jgi:hypothetical protein
MLALDLFNTKYERDLTEGAVDDLEARRIDTLNDRMQDLLSRAKEPAYQENPKALAALKKQFQQVKDERDSYYRVREAGIPGNVPVEKIPGKEDLLKGRGRSYYEADQKKNSEQVDEYISMGSDKNYQEAEPYKNYRIYVRKKPFGTTGMYTAHTEIDRKEFMGKGPSQQEAVQSIQDRIDFVLNAQRKVTGSSTIDFNVKFATDLLADPKQTFYAKLEKINGEPKLVIASPEVASDPELLAAGDFKRSALRNQPDDSGRATPLPGIPLTAKGLRSGDWIANGRYTVGKETQDRDGNRVFDLTYHSTAHTKSDKLRLNQPAFTLGTAREVDEEKNTGPLDQKLQRLKVQARRQFPRAHTDDEALLLKLLDKETQDDQANRRTDARQDAELRKNFAFDQEQEDEIQDLQAQVGVKEHGGGIGPRQHWQDLMQERKLSVGDPVVVTAPNEFEGKTGEIYNFAPSGKFVIVDLYNHGKHSMHLSDVEYNQYADDQEQDDWYDEGMAETVTDPRAGMAKIYRRLAPKIERYRDSFLAGQLYDELENYAELHGAESEFKRMLNGARNRAHMEYDTNPGGFENWFWFLPFADESGVAEGLIKVDEVSLNKTLGDNPELMKALDIKKSQSGKFRIYTGKQTPTGKWATVGGAFDSEEDAKEWIKAQTKAAGRRTFIGATVGLGILGLLGAGAKSIFTSDGPADSPSTPATNRQPTTAKEAVAEISGVVFDMNRQGISKEIALKTIKMSYSGVWRDIALVSVNEIYTPISLANNISKTNFQNLIWLQVSAEYYRQTGKELRENQQGVAEGWFSNVKEKMTKAATKHTFSYSMMIIDKLIQRLQRNIIPSDWIHGGKYGHTEGIELSGAIAMTKNPELAEQFDNFIFTISHWPKNNKNTDINLTKTLIEQLRLLKQGLTPYNDRVQKTGELNDLDVTEAQTDYQRRRQRERDVDAGKPVSRQPKNPQNDYFARRKKEKKHDMDEAISKKDLLSRLQKDLPKVTDPKNKDAKPVEWTGAGKDDYGYTGYQGHGMPTDKQERESARKKKGVAEMDKSQPSQERHGDRALGAKGATAKPVTARKVVKDLAMDLDQAFAKEKPVKEKGVAESAKPGEYYIHTVYFKDGTKKRVRVTSDEFDVADYYTKRGQAVDRVDYDFQLHSDMTEGLKSTIKEEQDTSGVERAILNRIMVAHTDLLMQFGPDKVMQAAEEVAYNVGDVDEIGTSDVSAYVAQVKQILGATP